MAIQELTLALYKMRWRSGGRMGYVTAWAFSERSAVRVVREHPSSFGIPHETVVLDQCRKQDIRPKGLIAA